MEKQRGIALYMRIVKRSEGSIGYILSWAMAILLLALGILCLLPSFVFFTTEEATFLASDANSALILLSSGFILILISLSLSHRQVRLLARWRKLGKMKDRVRTDLRLAESMGIDTQRAKERYEKVEAEFGFGKLERIERIVADCISILESRLTLHSDRLLEEARTRMERAKKSTNIGFNDSSLKSIRKNIEEGRYGVISRKLLDHRIAVERIVELHLAIEKAREMNVDTQEEKQFVGALEDFNNGNTPDARIESVRARDALFRKMATFVKERRLRPVAQKVSSFHKRGVPSTEALKLLVDAGTELLSGEMESSVETAAMGERVITDEARMVIEDSRERVGQITERAEKLGVDTATYLSQIETINEDLNEGKLEECLDKLQKAESSLSHDLNSILFEKFYSLRDDFEQLPLVPEFKVEFVNALREADKARKEGGFERAIELAEKLEKRVLTEGMTSRLREVESKLGSLESFDCDTSSIRTKLDGISSIEDEREAVNQLTSVLEGITEIEREIAKEISDRVEDIDDGLDEIGSKSKEVLELKENIKELMMHLERKDLERAADALAQIEGGFATFSKAHEEFRQELALLEDVISEAGLAGIQVPSSEQISSIDSGKALVQATNLSALLRERLKGETHKLKSETESHTEACQTLLNDNPEVDFSDIEHDLDQATTHLVDGRYQKALEISHSARGKAKGRLAIFESFQRELDNANEVIFCLQLSRTILNDYEERLVEVSEDGNYRHRIARVSSIANEALELENDTKAEFESLSEKLEKRIQEANEKNVRIESVFENYEGLKESSVMNRFDEAVEAIHRILQDLDQRELSWAKAQKRLHNLEGLLDSAKKAGLETVKFELEVREIKEDDDYDRILENSRNINEKLSKKLMELGDKAAYDVEEAMAYVDELAIRIHVNKVKKELEESQKLLREQKFLQAIELVEKVIGIAEETEKSHSMYRQLFENGEGLVSRAKEAGLDVTDLVTCLDQTAEDTDYASAFDKLEGVVSSTEIELEELRLKAIKSIQAAEDDLEDLDQRSIPTSTLEKDLEKLKSDLESGHFETVIEKSIDIRESVGKTLTTLQELDEAMRNLESVMDEAEKSGVSLLRAKDRLGELSEVEDLSLRLASVKELEEEVEKHVDTVKLDAYALLQKIRTLAEFYPSAGRVFGGLNNLVVKASILLEEGKIGESVGILGKAEVQLANIEETRLQFFLEIERNLIVGEDLKLAGVDVDDILLKLLILTGWSDFWYAHNACRSLSPDLLSRRETKEENLIKRLREVSSSLEDLKEEGIEATEIVESMKEGTRALREGRFYEAEKWYGLAERKRKNAGIVHHKLIEVVDSATDVLEEVGDAGLDADDLRRELEKCRLMLPHGIAIGSCAKVRAKAKKALEVAESQAKSLHGDLANYVEELASEGVHVEDLEKLLTEADEELDNRHFGSAINTIEMAKQNASERAKQFHELMEAVAAAREEIESSYLSGVKVEDIEKRVKDAEETSDYLKAIDIITEASNQALKRKEELKSEIESELERIRGTIDSRREKGLNVSEPIESLLSESKEFILREKYADAGRTLNRAEEMADELWSKYEEIGTSIEDAKIRVHELEDSLEERAKGHVERLSTRLDEIGVLLDYDSAVRAVKEVQSEASQILSEFKSRLSDGLDEVRTRLNILEQVDVDLSVLNEIAEKAGRNLEDSSIGEGLDLIDRALDEIGAIEQSLQIEEEILSIRRDLKKAGDAGIAIDDLSEEIPKAEDVRDLQELVLKLGDLRSQLLSRKEGMRTAIQGDIDAFWKDADAIQSSGVITDGLRELLKEAQQTLNNEEFTNAENLVGTFKAQKESMMVAFQRYSDVLIAAKAKEIEAGNAGVDTQYLGEALENTSMIGDYGESHALLENAIERIDSDIANSRDEIKNTLEETRVLLDELRNDGLRNLSTAEDHFSSAASKWNESFYGDAKGLAEKAIEACETARANHEALMEAKERAETTLQNVDEYLEDLEDDGIKALDAADLRTEARTLFDAESFEEAEKCAEEALLLSQDVREMYETSMKDLRTLRHEVEESGIRGLNVSGLLDDVDPLSEGHNYYELQLAIQRANEELNSRIESRKAEIRQDISSRKQSVESLLEDNVSTASPALDLLGQASQEAVTGHFSEAVHLIERAYIIETRAGRNREEKNRALAEVEEIISRVDKARLETDEFSKGLKSSRLADDDVEATDSLNELSQLMLSRLYVKEETVTRIVEDAESEARDLTKELLDISPVEKMISAAKAKADEGFLGDAENKVLRAKERIKELGDLANKRRELVDKAERTLWEAKKAGVDTSPLYVRMEKARLNPLIQESIKGIKEVRRNARENIKELEQGAEIHLGKVGGLILELEEKGIVNRELVSVWSSAKEMSQIGNYGDAIRLCEKAVSLAEDTESSYRLLQDLMDKAQRYLGEALRERLEVDDLIERLGRARSLDGYEDAIEIVREIITVTESRFGEEGIKIMPVVDGQGPSLEPELPRNIVDISEDPRSVKRVARSEETEVPEIESQPDVSSVSEKEPPRAFSHLERILNFARSENMEVDPLSVKIDRIRASLDEPGFVRQVTELRDEINEMRRTHLLSPCDCGAQNAEESRFCGVCGGTLSEDEPGGILPVGVEMICSECSRLYETGSAFCEVCGSELEEAKGAISRPLVMKHTATENEIRVDPSTERVFGRKDFVTWLPSDKKDYVSRTHFKLYWKGRRTYLENLSVTNPTKVNGIPVPKGESCEVKKGDRIDLADGVLVIEVEVH